MSLFKFVEDFDKKLTNKLALCSDPPGGSIFAYLRLVFIALEWSFHGVPWFVLVILAYATQIMPLSIAKPLFMGLAIDIVALVLLKSLFRRSRPVLNKNDMMATGGPDKWSFPSGHSTRAIMVLHLLIFYCSIELMSLSYVLLSLWSYLTCFSRILLARHHVSDVLAGILFGYLFSIFVVYFN